MDISLPLDQMSVTEKLRAIEAIWEDLSQAETALPSPDWHGDVLQARAQRLSGGEEQKTGWEQAKRRIREATE